MVAQSVYVVLLTQASPVQRIRTTLLMSMVLSALILASIWVRSYQPLEHFFLYYLLLLGVGVASATVMAYLQSATMVLCTHLDLEGHFMGYMLLGQAVNGAVGSAVNLVGSALGAMHQSSTAPDPLARAAQNALAAKSVFAWSLGLQVLTIVAFNRTLQVPWVAASMRKWMDAEHHDATMEGLDGASWAHMMRVQKKIGAWSVGIFGLFCVTLMVYPGLSSRIHTSHHGTWLENQGLFVALHMVALNFGDLVGRRLPMLWPRMHLVRPHVALACIGVRILFLPFILLCRWRWEEPQTALPDWFFFLLIFVLGVTTGSYSTSCLVSGPQSVCAAAQDSYAAMGESDTLLPTSHDDVPTAEADDDVAVASMLLSFWIMAGLTAGGVLSIILNSLLP